MIIADLPNAEYHARKEVSNSTLKLIGVSPAHFQAGHSGINPDIARIGTNVHSSVLEQWKGTVVIPESRARSSKDDRQWWADYFLDQYEVVVNTDASAKLWFPEFEQLTGLTVVTHEEEKDIFEMLESLDKNQEACDLLKDTAPELSVIGEIMGVPCRSRPDASNKHRIADVKSCADASERGFARACASLGYHRQDYFYSTMHFDEYGIWPDFAFIAIGKKKPFPVVVYRLCEEAKQNGMYLVERDLQTYKDCLKSGNWPCFPNNSDLHIPLYERPEYEDDNYEELMA